MPVYNQIALRITVDYVGELYSEPIYEDVYFTLNPPYVSEEDLVYAFTSDSCDPSTNRFNARTYTFGITVFKADGSDYTYIDYTCGFEATYITIQPSPLQMFSQVVEFKGDGSFNFGSLAGIAESELWVWKYRYQILSFPVGKIDRRVGNPNFYRFGYINPTNFGSSLESKQVNFVLGEGGYYDAFYSWEGQDPSGELNVSFPLSRPVANGLSWSLKSGVQGILSVRGVRLYESLNGYL